MPSDDPSARPDGPRAVPPVSPSPPPPPVGAPRDVVAPPALSEAAAVARAEPQPPTEPRRRRRLGLILGIALGGAVLLIAVTAVVVALLSAQRAPSASVDRFLNAIEKGHSSAAVAQLSPSPIGSRALVADDFYDHQANRITKHQILSTTTHGSHSVVRVRITTEKGSFTQAFNLVTHRKSFIWDIWTVDGTSFPVIDLADPRPDGVGVTVNGTTIQNNGDEFDTFVVLPGAYRFAPDADNSLVTTDTHTVTIGSFEGHPSVTLQPRLTSDGITQARAAVDAFLDACLAQPVLAPTGNCGFEIINDEPGVTIDSITWSMKQRPVVEFGAWDNGAWEVKTDTAGSFEMNGEGHLGSAHGEVDALIDDYDVHGYVALDEHGHFVFGSDYKGDDDNSGQPNA